MYSLNIRYAAPLDNKVDTVKIYPHMIHFVNGHIMSVFTPPRLVENWSKWFEILQKYFSPLNGMLCNYTTKFLVQHQGRVFAGTW